MGLSRIRLAVGRCSRSAHVIVEAAEITQAVEQGPRRTVRRPLKCFGNARLLQYSIGCVARLNLMVYWKFSLCDRTVPDFMIPFSRTVEVTAVIEKNSFNLGRIVRHQAATGRVVLSSR